MIINRKAMAVIICLIVIATSINAKGCNDKADVIVGNSSVSTDIIFTPYNLTAIIASQTQINILWIDNSSNETGFRIERSLNRNSGYELLATFEANVTFYEDKSISPGVDYYYRVCGFDDRQYSAYTNSVLCNTVPPIIIDPPPDTKDPWAPTALTYRIIPPPMLAPPRDGQNMPPFILQSSLLVSWSDNSDNENGFILESQAPGSEQWQTYAVVGPDTTSYWRFVDDETGFYLRVRAFNNNGYSLSSNIIGVFIPDPGVPVAPTSLAYQSLVVTLGEPIQFLLTIGWTDNSSNETGFVIEVLGDTGWWQFAEVGENTTSYSFSASYDLLYDFRIRAVNETGSSAPSNTISIWLPDLIQFGR
jgi:hypothetical protein